MKIKFMEIRVLGSESFGARSLACFVKTGRQRVLIDPGVALARLRSGRPPHPLEIAAAFRIKARILSLFGAATDVVISHYHGDHIPMPVADPYQLSTRELPELEKNVRFWGKGPEKISGLSLRRRNELARCLGRVPFPASEGKEFGALAFSAPVPHGAGNTGFGTVMMTLVREGKERFVHASDIQLLDRETVLTVLEWNPTIVLASGPPLYIAHKVPGVGKIARENAKLLAENVDTLILDHHLLRSFSGYTWLKDLARESESNVLCAAAFMGKKPELLEAGRESLYNPDSA